MSSAVAAHAESIAQNHWSAALHTRVERLCAQLAEYMPASELNLVRDACYFGAKAHEGVYRKSGEPYIFHPIAVAEILHEVRFDHATIIAAILHDVVEDTTYTKDDIEARFGAEIAELVDGVTKLTQIKFQSKKEAQAENFRKMFMAMARDIRVIMIKLADRLHNMRTLEVMAAPKRRRIARETLEIYAPIALRLGMNHLRVELEELGFRNYYPWRYPILKAAVARTTGNREQFINQLETRISERLTEAGLEARVNGREKHLWSIYRKMHDKKVRLKEINDLYAVRIIVDTPDTCYRVLGYLHHLYKPVMGRFKDYIAIPKANGYQSLHTVLFGPQGMAIEAQIRTHDMHIVAQTGVAAHWLYKAANTQPGGSHHHARQWLQKLMDIQRRAGDSLEFLESVKVDLFPHEIYVFTPAGEIIELPRGATVVDFAYAIHSDVGNTCVGGKVDFRFVPLRTKLVSGQTVEVIISPTARPDPAWLSFVTTAKARASIRHYLNHLRREDAVILGRRLLDKALSGGIARLKAMAPEDLQPIIKRLKANSFEDILADIGLGKRLAPIVAKHLVGSDNEPDTTPNNPKDPNDQPLLIKGTEGAVVNFGKCCRPIPGDDIIAHLSTGRGIVVHRDTCRNVADFEKAPDKWLEVEWENNVSGEFETGLRLRLVDKRGSLAAVAVALSEVGVNIDTINTAKGDTGTTWVDLVVYVNDRDQLAQVIRRLRNVPGTQRVQRTGATLHKS